jgi:hypothetical protein
MYLLEYTNKPKVNNWEYYNIKDTTTNKYLMQYDSCVETYRNCMLLIDREKEQIRPLFLGDMPQDILLEIFESLLEFKDLLDINNYHMDGISTLPFLKKYGSSYIK